MRFCLQLLLLICCCTSTALGQARTKVTLVLSAGTAKPGDTVWAGVELEMPTHWHTYWKNSGDLPGANTKIQWQLPTGVIAGETQWPVPEKTEVSGITSYVYNNHVVLVTPLKLGGNVTGPLEIKAKVSWTECDRECIQGKANVSATLNIGSQTDRSLSAMVIDEARFKVPPPATNVATAYWEKAGSADERPLIIEWKTNGIAADFFPYPAEDYEMPGTNVASEVQGKIQLHRTVKRSDEKTEWPKEIRGVLVSKPNTPEAAGYEVVIPVTAATSSQVSSPAPNSAIKSAEPLSIGFLLGKLFAAFLGGLILNIMPCVLPVIALKIFGFVQQSKESPGQVFKLGLTYTLGVLVSFLILAAVVIGFQKAGGAASWGMQMQYPHYRLALTIVAVLVALNLFGLFEITLSGRAIGAASELTNKQGVAGAFFNGVLATALATPCTAPFLAPAVGFAFGQPPYVIVLLFVAIALGLASPYLLLSWRPNWLKFLPKPGAWMEKFKVAMGFPMLAAGIWLFSLTAPSFGEDGELGLGLFLLMLALALWIWGQFVQRGLRRKTLAAIFAMVVLVAGYGYGLENLMHWRKPVKRHTTSTATDPNKIPWQIWSAEAVEKARAAGHPVLIDFTAKWCLTCEVNKKTSIEVDEVRKKLKEIDAVAFIGDNTDPDPAIVAELKKYERAGVPLVLVFPADPQKPAIALPDGLFTAGTLLEALEKATK